MELWNEEESTSVVFKGSENCMHIFFAKIESLSAVVRFRWFSNQNV